ncbi:MAG: glycosyltransferase family 1 protein, partial [Gemmatimonadales bacterium]
GGSRDRRGGKGYGVSMNAGAATEPVARGAASPPLPILVVAQTPPPVHGQAVATARFLEGAYTRIRLHHVRMAFSDEGADVGRFRLSKIGRLAGLVVRVVLARMRTGARVLYYPPGGPSRIPFARDVVFLGLLRPLFDRVVFHFHATGVSRLYASLGPVGRALFRRAYFEPDLAICLAPETTEDAQFIRARRVTVVPNGVDDPGVAGKLEARAVPPRILFVGHVRETKGVLVLLEACRKLHAHGVALELVLLGGFHPPEFEDEFRQRVASAGLAGAVRCDGEVNGADKWRAFAQAAVFCFPTYYEAETAPLALLEAMACGLPVVATRWRGIPSIVREGVTGYLVEPRHPDALADRLAQVLRDGPLRERLGRAGRDEYERRFTLDRHRAGMEEALCSLSASPASAGGEGR